ncbi:class I SAM-dependent methyltransferase [Thermoflexus sp.]|jgi:SAM-dependent methyltransferase|uniref:class I SAM-dependent methyltransferase n=1 Tax=Thermoflexus sp. TaxID=1969742 RepID=UPI002634CA2F|nr:class I SAM-dependent methyltransferase [Thermoflexus sp.]
MSDAPALPPICDYEETDYEAFWRAGRAYEDLAERIALRALLPPRGRRLVEIGAGFGRLADLYAGYEEVYLLDYARSQVEAARRRWGHDPRFRFVIGDLYRLPFIPGSFDTIVMVRVIHHVRDVPRALREIHEVLRPGGVFILEFANKRNLKAILRYVVGAQSWSPFSPEPVEFAPLHFDFHPAWMRARLEEAGFRIQRERAVSHFRHPWLKRLIPAPALARMDGWVQGIGALWKLTPSLFIRAEAGPSARPTEEGLWRCPLCRRPAREEETAVVCPEGHRWPREGPLYRMREGI